MGSKSVVNLDARFDIAIYAVENIARHVQYGERVTFISLRLYGQLRPIHPIAVACNSYGRGKAGDACESLLM